MARVPVIIDASEAPHAPNSETRRQVAQMVACGLEIPQIALILACTPHEVKYYYKDELEHGGAIVNGQVGAALLRNCLAGDTNAQKFWLATRAGWAPPPPDEVKRKAAALDHDKERKSLMDEIVSMVAREKVKEEQAETTARANTGSKRAN